MAIGRSKFVPTDVDGNPISGKGSDSQYRRRTETIRERLSSFTEEEEEEEVKELAAHIEDLRLEDTKADRFDGQGLLLTIEAKLLRMEKKLDILAAGGAPLCRRSSPRSTSALVFRWWTIWQIRGRSSGRLK
ncbi:hypothetical protein M885DRAFT_501638 [Pelagophyceae sp. CCMP2097]|nr:hypothetical protein M885DRAFT_501638 [Pelagophyceae sp. CCMP2097]|mmetsp:Transcript_21463/g.73961  ORF Transcript_21463/g.73961 Transcript_21463/m.73961 type:complete len:132 (-) Transcript_21463:279-674(-)